MKRRAFTLIELVVAIALLAIIVVLAAIIFRVALTSYRLAGAHTEIMGKLRLLTQQLDDDFSGLRRDAPVFIGWAAQEDPNRLDGYASLDRIVFFSQSRESFRILGSQSASSVREGSLARISYMLATVDDRRPASMASRERLLARTQHIMLPPETTTPANAEPNNAADWAAWNNDPSRQFDDRYYRIQQWLTMDTERMHEAVTGWTGMDPDAREMTDTYGTQVDMVDPGNSLHKILCQGVGQFRIQGWYGRGIDARWVPEPNDPNASQDADLMAASGAADVDRMGMLLYPYDPLGDGTTGTYGFVHLGGVFDANEFQDQLNSRTWNHVPGLGRALRFTFTLYDSKGLIGNGMTFTHIVYLDR